MTNEKKAAVWLSAMSVLALAGCGHQQANGSGGAAGDQPSPQAMAQQAAARQQAEAGQQAARQQAAAAAQAAGQQGQPK